MTPTKRATLETLAYFEQFGRALKSEELHQLLWGVETPFDIMLREVEDLSSVGTIVKDTYVALSEQSIERTKKRQALLRERRAAALHIGQILSRVPGIESVILMNSTAMQTLTKDSDLDFLIITEPDSLYVARTFALISLKSKGLAKTRNDHAGKACLGYWLSMDDLHVRQYQNEMRTAAYWMATMVPLFGIEGYAQLVKSNSWVKNFLPNWHEHQLAHIKELRIKNHESSGHPTLNRILFPIHRWKVVRDPEFALSAELVCEPNRLKLHSVDRRPVYGQQMQNILDKLAIN